MSIPTVVDNSGKFPKFLDIYSKLLQERVILLSGPIDVQTSELVVAQLLYLSSESDTKDISLYITSNGGEIYPTLAIYDTMQYIKPDVSTICIGFAASAAAVLLCSGTEGKRYALPNSTVMIHQILGGYQGQGTDIQIHANHTKALQQRIENIMAKHTNKPIATISKDLDRDYFMNAEEALQYGLIDKIVKTP